MLGGSVVAKPSVFTQDLTNKYVSKGYWTTETIADIWDRNAKEYPDKEAVVDSRNRLTWAEAKRSIDRIALGLLELGLKRDDVVVTQLPTCVESLLFRVACEKAGLICIAVIRNARHTELEYILKFSNAVGVVIPWKFRDFNYFQMINDIRPKVPTFRYAFIIGEEVPDGTISLKGMSQQPLEKKYSQDYLQKTKYGATDLSLVVTTTGTTGSPKLVEYPICSAVAFGKMVAHGLGLTRNDVYSAFLPAVTGMNKYAYYGCAQVGAKIVMMESFEAEEALELIQKEKITIVGLVPAMVRMMMRHPKLGKYDLSSLRVRLVSAAPFSYQEAIEAEEKLGSPLIIPYGSSDFGGIIAPLPTDSREVRLGTVGRPWSGTEARIVNEAGNDLPKGEIGELMVRGPANASGYYKDPENTWKAWTKDGWFGTRDLGKLDMHGNIILTGRKEDMFIRGGQNIFPGEVEKILVTHPKVSEVAIVGMPDPTMGERGCAYVVPKFGEVFTFDDMVSYLKQSNIASFKFPERLEIVNGLPMAAEQKVDKRALVQDIIKKLKAEGKLT